VSLGEGQKRLQTGISLGDENRRISSIKLKQEKGHRKVERGYLWPEIEGE